MPQIAISAANVALMIEVMEKLIEFLIKRQDLTPEDKAKVLNMKERLSAVLSKEERIANGDGL